MKFSIIGTSSVPVILDICNCLLFPPAPDRSVELQRIQYASNVSARMLILDWYANLSTSKTILVNNLCLVYGDTSLCLLFGANR